MTKETTVAGERRRPLKVGAGLRVVRGQGMMAAEIYSGCFAGRPGRRGNLVGVGFSFSTTTSALPSLRPSMSTLLVSRIPPSSTSMAWSEASTSELKLPFFMVTTISPTRQ